jgi:hypothetical protein
VAELYGDTPRNLVFRFTSIWSRQEATGAIPVAPLTESMGSPDEVEMLVELGFRRADVAIESGRACNSNSSGSDMVVAGSAKGVTC